MLERQEEKISRSLMTSCNVFCFGEPDYWRKRIGNVFKICFHHEQFFGKVFERKADKFCSILKSHRHNSKAHRVINLVMAKILKDKGFSDVPAGDNTEKIWVHRIFVKQRTKFRRHKTLSKPAM